MLSRKYEERGAVLVVAVLAAAMVLAGCGSSGPSLANDQQLANQTLDINPHDPATLADGNFVFPLDFWEPNWNGNEIDGNDENEPLLLNALMPRLFLIQPDGTSKINPDYLTSAAVTSTNPQVVTLDINPQARWTDGTPLTWRDI
ncbi:MAG TPA: ABC transporter family substrate-binding protein, partial [Pseudonocardiaceae bacterium]|nr:ABC transporter family substrate-binding protein [Pseudonocardiaceae bacterium]